MNLEEKQKFLIDFAFIITVFGIIFFSFKFAFLYLLPFLIGVIIANLVQKPAEFIFQKTKLKKEICAAVLSVMSYVAVLLLIVLLAWLIFSKTNSFIEYLSGLGGFFENATNTINQYFANFSDFFGENFSNTFEKVITDTLSGFTTKIISFISSTVTAVIKNIPAFFVTAVVTVVATCYIAKDYDRLKKFLRGIISEKVYKNIVIIKDIFTDSILKFSFGYLKLMSLTFSELLIGFFILDIKNFFIVALLVSVIDLLPIFGTGTVLLPWAVILFMQGDFKSGIGMIILYIVISFVRNFAEPKIIGKQIGINPLFTLVSMFVGLKVAGIVGIVIFTYYRNRFSQS